MYLLDLPKARVMAFHPRKASINKVSVANMVDGTLPAAEGVVLGYRFYTHDSRVAIIFFHGNGEIAADYDLVAPYFNRLIGASLLVVDYRGYGWSTGEPTFKALISDTEIVYHALPDVFKQSGLGNSLALYVMGRSIGSAPAIHLAFSHQDAFRGLVIESGFATLLSALRTMGTPLVWRLPDGLGNERKLRKMSLPLLVIHGEQDSLLPVDQGRRLFAASAATDKTFVGIPNASHNTVMSAHPDHYFRALADFIARTKLT